MKYSGIDLHSNNSVVTVTDEEDRVVAETLRVFTPGATSTPRSSGLTVSSGFFLVSMMLGSVT